MTCGVVMTTAAPRAMGCMVHCGLGSARVVMVMMMDAWGRGHVAASAADPAAAQAVAVHAIEAMMAVVVMMMTVVATEIILTGDLRDGICTRDVVDHARDIVHHARCVGPLDSPGRGRFARFARCWGGLDAADLHARPQDGNRNRLAQH